MCARLCYACLQTAEAEIEDLKSKLKVQRKEMEEIAAAKLEEAEATFSKQLAEVQGLLDDYQSQVCE